jgi:predicted nucleic acid-binding protein
MQDYVKMLKDLTAADERDQKVRERRLQLIEKDFVIARLVQYLDVLMKQLLEYPESIVDEVIALVQAQGSDARLNVSRKLENGISKIIKDSKEQLIKELSGLRAKYQDTDGLDQKIKDAVAEAIEEG